MTDTTREEMREAFEAWARAFGFPMDPHPTTRGYYREAHTTMAWHGWEAAWTASRQKALQEAAAIVDGVCPSAWQLDLRKALSSAIRSLGGITSNEEGSAR